MKKIAKLEHHLLIGIILGITIYVSFAIFSGLKEVQQSLSSFQWNYFIAALALALLNYFLRWFRWEVYLKELNISIPKKRSFLVFFSGFSMTISPGKVGEMLKSYLLKRSDKISISTTAPIVIAERITDVIALLIMVIFGLRSFHLQTTKILGSISINQMILFLLLSTIFGLFVLSNKKLAHRAISLLNAFSRIKPYVKKLIKAYDAMELLMRPRMLFIAVLLATGAWALEGLGLYLILLGFNENTINLLGSGFVYAFTTLLGAFSFLPGGLGVTEGAMGLLLHKMEYVTSAGSALAATYLIRFATLWFAVLLGGPALFIYRQKYLDDKTFSLDELKNKQNSN